MPLKVILADTLRRPHGYMLARVPGISFLCVGCNCLVTLGGWQCPSAHPSPQPTLTLVPLCPPSEPS